MEKDVLHDIRWKKWDILKWSRDNSDLAKVNHLKSCFQ